ncbi:MAG: M24 family metallopeptidase [Thermoleophilia bacterium]
MNIKSSSGCDSLLVSSIINVRYLTGFTGSSGCVLITPRQRLFFTDFRYRQQAEAQVRSFHIRIVKGAPVAGAVSYALRHRMKLGLLGYEGACLSQRAFADVKKRLKGVRLKDASGTVESCREIKSRREIEAVRAASALADATLKKLLRKRVTGRTEKEVAWMLERWLRESGSETLPFPVIVASGNRSAMPHGVPGERVIRKNELVVVDMGARIDGFGSDVTRTFATGKLSRNQYRIYETVREAQERALAEVAPGVSCAFIDQVARSHIAAAGHGDDFGHSLGHGVGLEPHEGPLLAPRSKGILASGMVVTVEPGIYVERVGGVRIEDTVVVGAAGPERLTAFTRRLQVLE